MEFEQPLLEQGKCRLCGKIASRAIADNIYVCKACERMLPMSEYCDDLLT